MRVSPSGPGFPGLIDCKYVPAKDFEMLGIPKERVLVIIARHGGTLIAVDEYPGPWAVVRLLRPKASQLGR